MKKILTLIPARMGSSRFPGKPMAIIDGRPMIEWVYKSVAANANVHTTAVATCDQVIFDHIESIGGIAVMTEDRYERASDRCAEALLALEAKQKIRYDIVVMVQGDEPMTKPEMLDEAIAPMLCDPTILVTNLLGDIDTQSEFEDPNCIKVVCDLNEHALYFSRSPIPSTYKAMKPHGKQVCVIPFARDFLIKYTELEPTPLEILESVDMMRVIENGFKIKMVRTCYRSHSVDTPEDLKKVEKMMREPIDD